MPESRSSDEPGDSSPTSRVGMGSLLMGYMRWVEDVGDVEGEAGRGVL